MGVCRSTSKKGSLRHGHNPKRGVLGTGTTQKRGVLGTGTSRKGGLRHEHESKKGGLKNWSYLLITLTFSCQHDQLVGVYSDRLKNRGLRHGSGQKRGVLGTGQARKKGGS